MRKDTLRLFGQCVLGLAFLGFACRALVPVGYMPAALADRGPIVLCHGGPVGALLARLGPPRSDHDGLGAHGSHAIPGSEPHAGDLAPYRGDPSLDAWDHCPLGASAAAAPLASSAELRLLALEFSSAESVDRSFVVVEPVLSYRSRAPPSI